MLLMNMPRALLWGVALMVAAAILGTAPLLAANTSFDRGLKFYQNGEYEKAVSAFAAAATEVPKSADAHFYVGLSHYQLKRFGAAGSAFDRAIALEPKNGSALLFRGLIHQSDGAYEKAITYFEKTVAADPELAQLAIYNIGISQFRDGNKDAAKTTLTRAIAADPKSDTATDAREFLAKVEEANSGNEKRWSLSASAGFQYDDNVTTDEIDVSTNLRDTAFVFEAAAAYKLLQGEPVDLEIGYDFFQSFFDDQTDFDLHSHTVSLTAEKEVGEIDTGLTYLYTRTLLGGKDFLGIHSVTPSLGYAFAPTWYTNFSYNYQDKNFISDNDRDADLNALGFNSFVFFMDSKAYVSFGYRIENEDTESTEFDYLGHFLHLKVKTPLPIKAIAQWNPIATVGWAYFVKNYSNETASIGNERKDERTTLTLDLTADITKHIQAKLAYERIEAISNLASSDFKENIVTFSVGVSY